MNIKEFATMRNVEAQTITRYIKRHEVEFKGHTKKVGKNTILDEAAIQLLDKKYPLPKPIEVVEDVESLKKVNKLQEEVIMLQRELNEAHKLIAEAKAMKFILEDTQGRLEATEKALEDSRTELSKFNKTIFGFYRKME